MVATEVDTNRLTGVVVGSDNDSLETKILKFAAASRTRGLDQHRL